MNHINQFQAILGSRQTGVKFNILETSAYNTPIKPMKFCEAVIVSLNAQLLLRKEDIECIGAQRSFGFYQNDQKFASQISVETNISRRFIEHAISQIPVIDIPVKNILLGSTENPDVTIAFVKPATITKLIFLYASLFEEKPILSPYFFMSVCANIAVQTYLTNKICISFGCPESRKEGRIKEDEIIVGIPNSLLNK
jgi:uncharacterized protein (DUF169 family)